MSAKARCHKCGHRTGPRVAPYVPTASIKNRTAGSKRSCGCCHQEAPNA